MLTAVSVAARSLSKRILEGRLQEKLSAVSEAEERVAARWRPLQEIVGFPDPWVSSPELLPSEACPLEGWVLDATGRPVEGRASRFPTIGRPPIAKVTFICLATGLSAACRSA